MIQTQMARILKLSLRESKIEVKDTVSVRIFGDTTLLGSSSTLLHGCECALIG